jgi:hypothetical protein
LPARGRLQVAADLLARVGDPSAVPSSSTAAKDVRFAGADHDGLLSDLGDTRSQTPDYVMTPSSLSRADGPASIWR